MTTLLWLYFIIGSALAISATLYKLSEIKRPVQWLVLMAVLFFAWPAVLLMYAHEQRKLMLDADDWGPAE